MKTEIEYIEFMFNNNLVKIKPPRRSLNEFPGFHVNKFRIYSNGKGTLQINSYNNTIENNSKIIFNTLYKIGINDINLEINNYIIIKNKNNLIIKQDENDILYFPIKKIGFNKVEGVYTIWNSDLYLSDYSKKLFKTNLHKVGEVNLSFAFSNTIKKHFRNKLNNIPVTQIRQDNIKRFHKTKNHFIKFKFFEGMNTSNKYFYELKPTYLPKGKSYKNNKKEFISRGVNGNSTIKSLMCVMYPNEKIQIINFNYGFELKYGSKILDMSKFNIWFTYTNESKPILNIATINNVIMFKNQIGGMYTFNNNYTALNISHIEITPTQTFYKYFNIPPQNNSSFGLMDIYMELDNLFSNTKINNISDNLFASEQNIVLSKNTNKFNRDAVIVSDYPWTPLFLTIKNTDPYVGSQLSQTVHAVASDSCNVTPWFLQNDGTNSIYGPRDLFWDEYNHNLNANSDWLHMTGIYSTCYAKIIDSNGSKMCMDIAKGAGKSGFYALSSGENCTTSVCDSDIEDADCEQGCGCHHSDNGVIGCQSTFGDWLGRGCSDLYNTSLNFAANIPRETCKAARGVFKRTSSFSARNARINLNIANNIGDINNISYYWQRWYIYPNVPAYLPSELLYSGLKNMAYDGSNPKNFKFITQNIFQSNVGNKSTSINIPDAINGSSSTNRKIGSVCILDLLWEDNNIPKLNSSELTINSEGTEFEYYSEHLTYYNEESKYKPPNYGIQELEGVPPVKENSIPMNSHGGPIQFSKTVVGCIRIASHVIQVGDQFVYTYNILNHDFDPKISKIRIPINTNDISNNSVKIYTNIYDEINQSFDDSNYADCSWKHLIKNNEIVFRVEDSDGEREYTDPSPPGTSGDEAGLIFSDTVVPLSWGTVSSFQFTTNQAPIKGNINLYNYMPIESINTDMQTKYANEHIINSVDGGQMYEIIIGAAIPGSVLCPGDVTGDNVVNIKDILNVIRNWGCSISEG